MANLQANLRSQYGLAQQDLPGLLRSVNRLFYENTLEDCYATLFFANYDDASRQLRYANCGHNPPLLLRADGTLDRLRATATVLGLFPEWDCAVLEVLLYPEDMLVIYTDGITEASNTMGEEFGEARLTQALQAQRQLSPESRRPTWRFPNELPIAGEPADVYSILEKAHRALAQSSYPKLLFVGNPGALISPAFAESFAKKLKNLRVVQLGAGRHYLQEDHAEVIGATINEWLIGLGVRSRPKSNVAA